MADTIKALTRGLIDVDVHETMDLTFFKGCAGEFVGSLLLMYITSSALLTGGASSAYDISWVFGATMLVLTYTFSGISGGHLNPAVSVGHMFSKNITAVRAGSYLVAQCLGASLGSTFARNLDGEGQTWNAVADGVGTGTAFWAEVMGTFCLVWVLLGNGKDAHALAPLSVGMTYFVLHIGMLNIDGCSINPARSFGTANANNEWGDHWVFWVGPMVGALLASKFRDVFAEEEAAKNEDAVETLDKGTDSNMC